MTNVGIIGAGGYAGVNLLSLLLRHKQTKVIWLMSEEAHKGKKISELYPHLLNDCDLVCQTLDDLDKVLGKVDLVFLALPHGIALNHVPKILSAGKKVVDLGADYRFDDEEIFKKWYKIGHPDKGVLSEAVFGLPELYKDKIKKARLVANPGCYPTASILGLAPLVKEKLVDLNSLVVDAKSGISGAGRGVSLKVHFCERDSGIAAYNVTTHRHMGEIEYQLSKVAGQDLTVTFVPHLAPMNRGILATCYAKLVKPVKSVESVISVYKEFYKGQPFVRVYGAGEPCTKNVAGTNFCDIGVAVNEVTGMVIVMSCIDNLIKGAAGQAVQNLNLMLGYPEEEGLKSLALYP
jgi:N-acetyl-gamma-glutamyl-phosphate reductase